MNNIKVWGAIVLGLLLIGIGIYYWLTPAGALPSFFPGFEQGVTTIHFKHGLASFILGIAAFLFAWFASAPASAEEEHTA
jgi:hypothetical protein